MKSTEALRQRVEFHVNFATEDEQYPTSRKTSIDRIRDNEDYALCIATASNSDGSYGPSVYFTSKNYQAFEFLLDKTLNTMKQHLNELYPDYMNCPDVNMDAEAVNVFVQEYGSIYEDVEIIPSVVETVDGYRMGIKISSLTRAGMIVMGLRDASRLNQLLKKIEPNVLQLMLICTHIPYDIIPHF